MSIDRLRAYRPWFVALLLLVPAGGTLAVWLATAVPTVAAPPPPDQDPAPPGSERAVAEEAAREAMAPPSPTGNALGDALLEASEAEPRFTDPAAKDRLEILAKMIAAYNGLHSLHMARGQLIGSLTDRPSRRGDFRKATVPTADELKAWFAGLDLRARTVIDPRFHLRSRYLEAVRAEAKRRKDEGTVDLTAPGGDADLFADPMDVFVSPRDGKPFLIGLTAVPYPDDGRPRDPRRDDPTVIAREADGVATYDYLLREERRQVLCVGPRGPVRRLDLAVKAAR